MQNQSSEDPNHTQRLSRTSQKKQSRTKCHDYQQNGSCPKGMDCELSHSGPSKGKCSRSCTKCLENRRVTPRRQELLRNSESVGLAESESSRNQISAQNSHRIRDTSDSSPTERSPSLRRYPTVITIPDSPQNSERASRNSQPSNPRANGSDELSGRSGNLYSSFFNLNQNLAQLGYSFEEFRNRNLVLQNRLRTFGDSLNTLHERISQQNIRYFQRINSTSDVQGSNNHQEESKETLEEESDSNKACTVCLVYKKNYAFIPCGHKALCGACVQKKLTFEGKCVICRKHFEKIVKIFE